MQFLRGLSLCLISVSSAVHAGAYIFAGEANGVDVITHPNTYFGSGGAITVRVCIVPGSDNAADMEYSVQNIVATYNQFTPSLGNISFNTNNVPSDAIDFESVALHEVGHCLGLAHTNAATESGLSGDDMNYTKATDGADNVFNLDDGADDIIGSGDDIRGDDVNLFWFQQSNNDPFTIGALVDSTTYSNDVADLPAGHTFAANPDRDVSTLLGYAKTEAVMQQGTFFNEAQRELGHDDVATLLYSQSGLNERVTGGGGPGNNNNAADNYSVTLEYGGISSTNCDINMTFSSTSSLAFCSANGVFMSATHTRVTTADIEFGDGYTWFFNAPNSAPVLAAIGNQVLTEGDNLVIPLSATDVDHNTQFSFTGSVLPGYASLFDNGDGTATLTIAPVVGDAEMTSATVTVADDGDPVLTDDETFDITIIALDTDGDGLSDYDEINVYFTSPTSSDSDGDFINDFDEVNNGSDPNDDTSWPNFATGDVAPLGAPDGVVNAADYLVTIQIALGLVTATSLELAYGDLYPVGAPDGVIDVSDLILLIQIVQ